ncbi:unnamed protein product [Mucor circinelloides]
MAQIGREKIQRIYFVNDTKQFDKLTGKVSHFVIDVIKNQITTYYNKKLGLEPKKECTQFYKNVYKLPCRHLFDPEDLETAIPLSLVDERWLLCKDATSRPDQQEVASQTMCPADINDIRGNLVQVLYGVDQAIMSLDGGASIKYINELRKWNADIMKSGRIEPLKPLRKLTKSEARKKNRIPLRVEKVAQKIRDSKDEKISILETKLNFLNETNKPIIVELPEGVHRSLPKFMLPYVRSWRDVG